MPIIFHINPAKTPELHIKLPGKAVFFLNGNLKNTRIVHTSATPVVEKFFSRQISKRTNKVPTTDEKAKWQESMNVNNVFIGDDKITTATGGDVNFAVQVAGEGNALLPDQQPWVSSRDDKQRTTARYHAVIYQTIGNLELYYRNHGSIEFEVMRDILQFCGVRSLRYYCVSINHQYRIHDEIQQQKKHRRRKEATPSAILRMAVAKQQFVKTIVRQFGLRHSMFGDFSEKGFWRSKDVNERLLYILQDYDPLASTYGGLHSTSNVNNVEFAKHFGVSKFRAFCVLYFVQG